MKAESLLWHVHTIFSGLYMVGGAFVFQHIEQDSLLEHAIEAENVSNYLKRTTLRPLMFPRLSRTTRCTSGRWPPSITCSGPGSGASAWPSSCWATRQASTEQQNVISNCKNRGLSKKRNQHWSILVPDKALIDTKQIFHISFCCSKHLFFF